MSKLYTLGLAAVLFCTLAYAKKYPMTAATIVPGARADVEAGKDKNGNTKLKMTVQNLAAPEELTPAKQAYVIWLQERGGVPENQGRLKVDKHLKASFETSTPLKTFDIFVTAEQAANAKSPGETEVLRATIQR